MLLTWPNQCSMRMSKRKGCGKELFSFRTVVDLWPLTSLFRTLSWVKQDHTKNILLERFYYDFELIKASQYLILIFSTIVICILLYIHIIRHITKTWVCVIRENYFSRSWSGFIWSKCYGKKHGTFSWVVVGDWVCHVWIRKREKVLNL